MKLQGKSTILLAFNNTEIDMASSSPRGNFSIIAIFAISDQIRPEAPAIISQLHVQEIETWMISGNNETWFAGQCFARQYEAYLFI